MATKLEGLRIEEVSGVDEPANEVPGWLVMKSASGLEGILQEVQEVRENLDEALEASETYLGDAPEDVQAAAGTLQKWLGGDAEATLAERVRARLTKRKEDQKEMLNEDRLNEILDEREANLLKELASQIEEFTKNLEPEDKGTDGDPEDKSEETPEDTATAEAVTKLETELAEEREAHEATREALVKTIERVERLEKSSARRTSVDGQEDNIEKSDEKPSIGRIMTEVAKGRQVTLT